MSRVQLALNVADLDEAVAFYSKLFASAPSKRKPGYANFEVADPPLKLVLFEDADGGSRLNHLGVEVADSDAVWAHQQRLADDGIDAVDDSGTCCFARQDKVWVDAPDGEPWEIYTVLADAELPDGQLRAEPADGEAACCAGPAVEEDGAPVATAGCC